MTKEQTQFDKIIQDKVNSYKSIEELILEISRVNYYSSQLTSKLWQDVKKDPKGKKAITSQKNSKPHAEA